MRWLYAFVTSVMWCFIVPAVWGDGFASAPIFGKAITLGVVAIATIVVLDAIKDLRQH